MSGYYDTALICINGHIINKRMKEFPAHNSKFCDECGAENIHKCEVCNTEIRGRYNQKAVLSLVSDESIPFYCHNCGKPYPWTKMKLEAIEEIVELVDELNDEEKDIFKDSVRYIATDNPKTKVSVMRIKKFGSKIGETMWNGIKEMIVEIASETALKAMGLQNQK